MFKPFFNYFILNVLNIGIGRLFGLVCLVCLVLPGLPGLPGLFCILDEMNINNSHIIYIVLAICTFYFLILSDVIG